MKHDREILSRLGKYYFNSGLENMIWEYFFEFEGRNHDHEIVSRFGKYYFVLGNTLSKTVLENMIMKYYFDLGNAISKSMLENTNMTTMSIWETIFQVRGWET